MPSSLESEFHTAWKKVAPDLILSGPDTEMLADVLDITTERTKGKPPREISHRFDFVHYPSMTIFECNGGTYSRQRSGHSSPMGINKDYYKLMAAQMCGWQLHYLDARMCKDEPLLIMIAMNMRDRQIQELRATTAPNIYLCTSYQNNEKKNTQYRRCELGLHRWLTQGCIPSYNDLGSQEEILANVLTFMPKSRASRVKPTAATISAVLRDHNFTTAKVQLGKRRRAKGKPNTRWKTTYCLPPRFDFDKLLGE